MEVCKSSCASVLIRVSSYISATLLLMCANDCVAPELRRQFWSTPQQSMRGGNGGMKEGVGSHVQL